MHRSSLRYGSVFSSNAWLVNDWAAYNVHLKKQHAFNIFPNMRSIYESLVQKTKLNNPDETLNQGPDSLWSLKIPGCPSKKSKDETSASWPEFALWPLTIMASLCFMLINMLYFMHVLYILCWYMLIAFFPPTLHQYSGVWWAFWRNLDAFTSCTLNAAHWWWLRRFFYVKGFEYPEKRYINVINYYYYVLLQTHYIPSVQCLKWNPSVRWCGFLHRMRHVTYYF